MNTTFDKPCSPALDLEISRSKLLDALAGASDVTLIRTFGNMGDHLIHAGTRRLLAGIAYREVSVLRLESMRGELAVLCGGGCWCHPHPHMAQYLPQIEDQFERVVVFPSSFDVTEEGIRQALSRTKALVFARERASYEQIRDICHAELAHDCAFFFDYSPYQRAGQGLLTAYRTDEEAVGRPIPPDNNDISMTCESLDEFLWTIAGYETVETDRAHVMIAGALLGKRVFYNSSNYHKVPALAEFNLTEYPVFRLGESRAEVIKEQVLSEARKYERQLPADFLAAHSQLEVTVVMLSHGRVEQTLNAIRALQEHVRIPFKLLLIDNNSGEEVQRRLAEVSADDERIELILLDENLGCAGGRAYGLRRLTTPYALLLDNDVEVMPGAVEHLLHRIEQHSQLVGVMGKIVFPDGGLHLCGADYRIEDGVLFFDLLGSGRRFDENVGESGPCHWVSGTMTLFRTAVFANHPFDVSLGQYYEDLEWCYRLNTLLAGRFHRSIESLAIHYHEPKVPASTLPVAEQRRQVIKYVESIASFYERHGVMVQNLFDFVPELITSDSKLNTKGGKLLLSLVNAYGGEWALEQWNGGQFAPLFAVAYTATEIREKESKIQSLINDVVERQSAVESLAAQLAETHEQVLALTEQVAERQSAVESLAAQLAETQGQALALTEQMAERQSAVESLAAQRAETQGQALALTEQMADQQRSLESLTSQLTERDRTLEMKQAQLDKITGSMAWRVFARYGQIKYRYLLPLYRLLRLAPPHQKTAVMEQVFQYPPTKVDGELRA